MASVTLTEPDTGLRSNSGKDRMLPVAKCKSVLYVLHYKPKWVLFNLHSVYMYSAYSLERIIAGH